MMSALLSSVVQKVQCLPEAIQDELAEQFIEDIENETKWQETLAKPQDPPALTGIPLKKGDFYSSPHFLRGAGGSKFET
jgi:hypothetical protein